MLFVMEVCCLCSVLTAATQAAVNLELRPVTTIVEEGLTVDVGVYAVADSGENEGISALDIVIKWDSDVLGAVVADATGAFGWGLKGFLDDSGADGLNDYQDDDLVNDGDALYQAITFLPAVATPEGLLITTFRFSTIARGRDARVTIVPKLGNISRTKVFKAGEINVEITGTLGRTAVNVLCPACLIVTNVKMLAGRESVVFVSGEIVNQTTLGVTVTTEIIPGAESFGVIKYTPAPPVDVQEIENPWGGVGTFNAFDTDQSLSDAQNGSISVNGTLDPVLTSFVGTISRFPIVADADAEGTWNIHLEIIDFVSTWDKIATSLMGGTIQIVEPFDGDGDQAIDTLEYSRLQRCFTGSVGFVDPPAYTVTPELNCGVYDFDGDGDVDGLDYEEFKIRFLGPGL